MVTLTNAENVLKTVYLDVLQNQLNTGVNPFYSLVKKSSDDIYGKEVRMLSPVGVNGGISAGDEAGALPAASGNGYVQFVTTLKNLYGQIEITDKAIRASQNDSGAFLSLLQAEMEGLLDASKLNLGRMLFGNGTGKIARVKNAVTNNATIPLLNPADVRLFTVGQKVDFIKGATVHASGKRITGINYDTGDIILSEAVSPPVDCDIYIQDSKDKEIIGLAAIFDSALTSLYGVNKASNPWLKPHAQALTSPNNEITDLIIQKSIDAINERTGNTPDVLICSAGVRRAYQEYLQTYKRSTDVMELAGGYKAISYNGIPLVYDRFCPDGTMYLLNSKDFRFVQLCDWRWLEAENGSVLHKIDGKAAYTATLVKYAELVCRKPGGQGVITGIKEA